MQRLETCLLIAEAHRVLCHLVMFKTVFFYLMYKMKYSCYQDCSVIQDIVFKNELTHLPLLEAKED